MNKKALIAASIVTLAAIIVLGWTGVLHANDENIASSISDRLHFLKNTYVLLRFI